MKKFKKLLENTFKQVNLKKVRLKVDPAFCEKGEISKYQGYIGYILSENESEASIYIEDLDVIATIPMNMIDTQVANNKIDQLKMNALSYLKTVKGLPDGHNLVTMVMNSPTVETLETYLLSNGCNDKDLVSIYRMDYETPRTTEKL